MYADREEAATAAKAKSSIKERLNGRSGGGHGFTTRRNVTGKRQRQDDDKWEHDIFKDGEPRVSCCDIPRHLKIIKGPEIFDFKLQRKGLTSTSQNGNGSQSGGVHDLREKLSGKMHTQPANNNPPKQKPVEQLKPARKVVDAAPSTETKKVVKPPSKKNKVDAAVDNLLQSLGLEKYLITFKAEEVDMTALIHMSEDDLEALGIPMRPRKKILLALESRI